ncbi:MAG: LysR substrate-binding domain-containing protein [Paracoccaceae bacterium]
MPSLRRSLASLSALATFEAAARHGSFTLAAVELGVSQAAVSRQVKALEDDLGAALFLRRHRQVELTHAGRLLSASVTTGFDRIAETIASLRQSHGTSSVTIGATLAMSHFWLLPRLTSFRSAHPGVQMRVISQDAGFDLRRGDAQIVIRYGRPPFPGARVIASLADDICPVCSPAFRDGLGGIDPDAALFGLPLIATDWPDPGWETWGIWAERAGLGRPDLHIGLRFSHYADTIQAVMNGEGVALGWVRLVSGLLEEGRLVRLGSRSVPAGAGYHVVVADDYQPSPAAALALDWMAAEIARATPFT